MRVRSAAWTLFAGSVLVLVIWTFVWPQSHRHGDHSLPGCASNLKQIGQAIVLYANENKGAFPPDLFTIYRTQDLVSEVFCCPASSTEKFTTTQPSEVAEALASPRHCSYVYAPPSTTLSKTDGDDVIAFEKNSEHFDKKVAVLFADGHVEFIDAKRAETLLVQFRTRVEPLRVE